MARTERYTADQVIEALNRGYTALGAAQLLGCDAQTIRNYAAKYPTVDKALRAKRREMVDLAEMGLRGAILRGEGWAIMGVLKTLGREDGYGDALEVKHSGQVETHIFDHGAVTASLATGSTRYRDPSGADEGG